MKKEKNLQIKEKGITLIALVITIVVLLILAGVTLNTLLSEDGAIKKAAEAREATDISNEKDTISMSVLAVKTENKKLTQDNLQENINNTTGNKETRVEDMGDDSFLVFFPSKRVYEVDKYGNAKYAGKENEIDKVIVTIDKERDLELKQIQQVQINIKKYNAKADATITLQYAWSTSKTDEPKSYTKAEFEEDIIEGEDTETITSNKTAIIDSGEQPTNSYYLWVKVNIGSSQEIKRTYGEYKIQEYTTLVNTSKEKDAESGFLGNNEIQRGNIKSITFTNKINEPTGENVKSWNPGNKEGTIKAWYTTETTATGEECYNVTIGQEGGVKANANSGELFRNIGSNLNEEVKINGLNYLDTSSVITMEEMFSNCKKIKNLDISSFKTGNVTNMRDMFSGCENLTSLNVSSFDTSKVTKMYGMFKDCKKINNLDLNKFDTSNVRLMFSMFSGCEKLTSLNISSFDTSNVTNMDVMFQNCQNLANLNLSKFNTSSVTTMDGMFSGCESLTSLDVSSFDTSKVTHMQGMFANCKRLESLDLSSFDTSSAIAMWQMFINCENLTSLNLSNFNTSGLTNLDSMFSGCEKLTKLDLSGFDISNITNMWRTFNNCNKLNKLDLRNWIISEDASSHLSFGGIPNDCEILVSTQEMKDLVSNNNSRTNVKIVNGDENIIESNNE